MLCFQGLQRSQLVCTKIMHFKMPSLILTLTQDDPAGVSQKTSCFCLFVCICFHSSVFYDCFRIALWPGQDRETQDVYSHFNGHDLGQEQASRSCKYIPVFTLDHPDYCHRFLWCYNSWLSLIVYGLLAHPTLFPEKQTTKKKKKKKIR